MEIVIFSALVPDGAPQNMGNARKQQKKSLKGWKLQFFQQFGRSLPKQRNAFKILQKSSNTPSVM
jgi:hypothetical protein